MSSSRYKTFPDTLRYGGPNCRHRQRSSVRSLIRQRHATSVWFRWRGPLGRTGSNCGGFMSRRVQHGAGGNREDYEGKSRGDCAGNVAGLLCRVTVVPAEATHATVFVEQASPRRVALEDVSDPRPIAEIQSCGYFGRGELAVSFCRAVMQ
jgi:hypothetical protein